MTNKDDYAFASKAVSVNGAVFGSDGLTKREYFAAMAMQGLMANPIYNAKNYADAMREAVTNADALIEVLNK